MLSTGNGHCQLGIPRRRCCGQLATSEEAIVYDWRDCFGNSDGQNAMSPMHTYAPANSRIRNFRLKRNTLSGRSFRDCTGCVGRKRIAPPLGSNWSSVKSTAHTETSGRRGSNTAVPFRLAARWAQRRHFQHAKAHFGLTSQLVQKTWTWKMSGTVIFGFTYHTKSNRSCWSC